MSQTIRIVKKIFYLLITVFFVLVFNFILFRLLPGTVTTKMAHSAAHANATALSNLNNYYGLDQSMFQQFLTYFKKLMHLDLGTTFASYGGGTDVWQVMASRIGPTVILLGLAEIFSFILGIIFGVIAGWKHGKPIDKTLLTFSLTFYAMPIFWLSMLLILVFCTKSKLLPSMGMYTTGYVKEIVGASAYYKDVARHMILPLVCMSLGFAGEYTLTMRSTMMDVITEDYMTTARAKGFKEGYVLRKHALPNAMLPMVTLVCMNLGFAIGGAITLEKMFSWPGIGMLTYTAIENRDYTLLQGIFLLTTVSTIVANFLADILYGFIDPRIKNS
jgi:peptide/nickel transport system permease protein